MAGVYTTAQRVPSWVLSPTLGDGSTVQGGDPPVVAYEPEAIDEAGNYVRSEWLTDEGIDRIDHDEAKFRLHVMFSHFGLVDPLVMPGMTMGSHHHTFFGNRGTDENSNYQSLRENPASTASGGPLNATAYWEPTLGFEGDDGVWLPIKPNIASFYYAIAPFSQTVYLYRLLRGLTFIGGCDPADRLNTARLAEIPDGAGWVKDGSRRYNGWMGWSLYNPSTFTAVPVDEGSDADICPETGFPRQLVNSDGSDPWGGAGESTDLVLIANVVSPSCWDGHNLTSPNGRDHFRYPIFQVGSENPNDAKQPNGWWKVPFFEVKTEFPSHCNGYSGHEFRRRLWLSSDRYNADGTPKTVNDPRGSTMHFDWMNGWDNVIIETWQHNCTGTTIGELEGDPLTCGNSTISDAARMLVLEPSPDPSLSLDPPISFLNYGDGPARDMFGPLPLGTVIATATVADA